MFPRSLKRLTGALAVAAVACAALPAGAMAATSTFTGVVDAAGTKFNSHNISVTEPGTITATLDWDNAAANLNLFLVGPNSTAILAQATSTTAKPETLTFEAVDVGTYKVQAKAITGAASYTLTATYPNTTAPPPGGRATFSQSIGFDGPAGLYAYGMDWDESDDTILVGDYWNYRIWRYTKAGVRIGPASSFATGGMPGGTTAPYDVEADMFDKNAAGKATVWSADQGSSRIVQFDHNGAWLQTIGAMNAGLPTGTGTEHPGANYAFGCGAGKMQIPTHIVVDDVTGVINVSDPRCRAIYRFDHKGNYLGEFDWTQFKNETGIFQPIPRGLAQDSDGRIYVAEFNSRRIVVFDRTGAYLGSSLPAPKVAGDGMNDVRGLDVDRKNGFIYTVAAFYNRVFQWKISAGGVPTYVKRWSNYQGDDLAPTATRPRQKFDSIRFPAVDGDGNVYVGETWGCATYCPGVTEAYGYGVVKFDPNSVDTDPTKPAARLPWSEGPLPPPKGGFNQQNGIGVAADGSLFVVDTFEQRVQKFNTASTCTTRLSCPAWLTQWGSREPAAPTSSGFGYPRFLTMGDDGNVWVGDNNNAILTFTQDGTFVHRFGSQGPALGQFKGGVQGMRVTATKVYATDVGNCRLQVFDRSALLTVANGTGALLDNYGSCGTAATQMATPRGVEVSEDESTAYVVNSGNSTISKWNLAAHTAVRFNPTCDSVKLANPWGITWDPTHTWLYIGDVRKAPEKGRIVRWNGGTDAASSVCQTVVTAADVPNGDFQGSNYLDFGPDGRLWASDNSRHVYAFTITG